MRNPAILTLIVLFAASAGAQYHTAGYASVTWSSGGPFALKTDMNGKVTSIKIGSTSRYQCEMGDNNKLVLIPDSTSSAIWQLDPVLMAITGTLVSSSAFNTSIYGMNYDHNGDLFVATRSSLFRVSPAGAVTTAGPIPSTSHMGEDVLTGELFISSSTLYRLDRNTLALTTLGTGFSGRYGDLLQNPLTGDIFVPTCCGWSGLSLHVLKAGSSVASIYLASNDLAGAYGPNLDRISAANPRLVTGSHVYLSQYPNSGGMWYIDLTTGVPQNLAKWQLATIADTTILESRNLHSVRTATGMYDVRINIPSDGGKSYLLGFSFTGVVPALPLPDGRRLPLVVDNLTFLTVNNLSAPYFTGTVGILDPFGMAPAKVNVSSFYNLLKGMKLWMVAVTLDPKAPIGIATITDPKVLKFD